MEREIAPLVKGWKVYLGNRQKFMEHGETIVVFSGVGRAAAEDATEAVITRRDPEIIISAGYAGALTPNLKAGALVVPEEVVDAASGERFRTLGRSGVLISAASVLSREAKREYASRFHADVVDMEAAAVAVVAKRRERKFLAIKAVSDELDFQMPPMDRFVSPAGKFRTARFAVYAGLHPSLWPDIRTLARNSQGASLTLVAALAHLIIRRDPTELISSSLHVGREVV